MLLKSIQKIKEKNSLKKYYQSDHYLHTPTYSWQAGYTFLEDVNHLIPNHLLDVISQKQIRFFPDKIIDIEENSLKIKKN